MTKQLKIAITHMRHARTGGVERYLNYVSSYLAEQGHDVTIICRTHEEKPHPNINFVVFRSAAFGSAHRIYSFAKAVENHIANNKYDIVYGLGRTWSQDVLRLGGGSHLTYLEKSHCVTHSVFEKFSLFTSLYHRFAAKIERKALTSHLPLKVICNSHMVKRDVVKRYNVPEERVVVIHNGTDTQRFNANRYQSERVELRNQIGIALDEIVFLFLGTGYRRKGLEIVLKAFAQYLSAGKKARLLVAGYDSSIVEFKRLAEQLNIAEYCHFLGGRSDVEIVYAASDVYLLPTRYDPFANSTVEALASGLPVITSENNGGSELIQEGVCGSIIKFDGTEINQLCDAMQYWSDSEKLRKGSYSAREVALQNEISKKMRETIQVLTEVYQNKKIKISAGTGEIKQCVPFE